MSSPSGARYSTGPHRWHIALIILGLSGALNHDPAAAVVIDGEVVAAAEEERFVRDKHAKNRMPLESARYCLAEAGVPATQLDAVAFPYAPVKLRSAARWHYARRHWYAPERAVDALLNGNRRFRRNRRRVLAMGSRLGRMTLRAAATTSSSRTKASSTS